MGITPRSFWLVVLVALATAVSVPVATGPAREDWDYTALGDSIATGYLAVEGYVSRYQGYLGTDTGADVTLYNLGKNGQTSGQLLASFQDPRKGVSIVRTSVQQSEVVTWNIGLNDFRNARTSYKNGKCGGQSNQACLVSMVSTFKTNWDAILLRIVSLRNPLNDTIVRTADIYNPWVQADAASNTTPDSKEPAGVRGTDLDVLGYYLGQMNAHIAMATASYSGISVAPVSVAFNGAGGTEDAGVKGYLAGDGVHPSDVGHLVIADALRAAGYAPLR